MKLLFTAFLWGGTFIAGRTIAQHVGPFSAAFLRFAIAAVFLFFLVRQAEGRIPTLKRHQLLPIILLGMTGVFLYNVCFFKGLKLIHAGRASLIIACNPILIALLSAWFFKERLTVAKVSGIIISITGAMIVISRGNFFDILDGHLGWGEFYIFCCVLSWVTFSLIGKQVIKEISPLTAILYSASLGAAFLFLPAFFEGMFHDLNFYTPLDWISLFYLGFFGTVIGFVWYYEGIKKIGPMKAGLFINFVPASAILLSFVILKEPVTPSLLVGAVFVCSGIYLTNTVVVRIPRNAHRDV